MTSNKTDSSSDLDASERPTRKTGRRLAKYLGFVLVIVATTIWFRTRDVPPTLPPAATASAIRVQHPLGFSLHCPSSWSTNDKRVTANNPAQLHSKISTSPTESQTAEGLQKPMLMALINYPIEEDVAWGPARRTPTTFQGRPARIFAGRFNDGMSLFANLQTAYQIKSFKGWLRTRYIAFWGLEFERHGQKFIVAYSVPTNGPTRIEPTTIPPEIMSYFETFEYTPPEPSDDQQ